MTDNTQEPRDLIQICTDIYYECNTIKRLDELTDEALDWHNKQLKSIIEATYDNLPSLNKLTVGNEMSDGYDQGVEAFRQAITEALYGKGLR